MPLQSLATEIVRLSERHALTPVLVMPSYLSLREAFFIELCTALSQQTQRPIRIDWLLPQTLGMLKTPIDLIRTPMTQRRIARMNRQLHAVHAATASIQVTATIARPASLNQSLVIGCCAQHQTLPDWTIEIRLGASPEHSSALQSA